MNAQHSPGLASAAVFLSAAVWGLFWIPIRVFEAHGIGGEWALIALYFPAFLVLLPVVAVDLSRQIRHIRSALIIGACLGAALAFFGVAILHTSVVRATMLFYLSPVWATLISQFWLAEAPTLRRWIGIVLGLAGLVLLVFERQLVALSSGDILALLSGLFWAVGLAGIKRAGIIPIAGLSMFQFLFAVLFIFALARLYGQLEAPAIGGKLSEFFAVVGVSICFILPAVFLLAWASRILYPGRVGLLMMSEALVAVATASTFLPEETLTTLQWAGGALIVTASLVELLGNSRDNY